MGLRANPTYRQRRLGSELRRMRDSCGLSAASSGALINISSAHMSHIETGRTGIPEVKLRALAAAYGCNNEDLIDTLVAMSKATGRGWWSEYKRFMSPQGMDLAELEASTTVCRSFQWLYLPGLLQTPDYVRALIQGGEPGAGPELIDKYVEFRLRRQHVLAEGALQFHVVIHESALRMQFVPDDIMRRQIEHLVKQAQLPHVRIQILPFKANLNPPNFSTPFVLFEPSVPELGTVYVEQPISSPFISNQEHLVGFNKSFESLSAVALPSIDTRAAHEFHANRDSLGLIQHLLYTL